MGSVRPQHASQGQLPTPVETKVCHGSGARIGGRAAMGLGKVDGLLARGEEGKPPYR